MTRSITEQYLENYLDEKYDSLCKELLLKELDAYQGLPYRDNGLYFSNIFEELIFVCLYDEQSFKPLQENIINMLFSMLKEIPEYEVDLLVLRPVKALDIDGFVDNYDILERKELYIARQILIKVNDKLLEYFATISEKKYEQLTKKLIDGIKNFAFSCSLLGADYRFHNYWEEYCFILQDDGGLLTDLYIDTIFDYIKEEVQKLPYSELKVLFSSSPELWAEDYQNPFSDGGDMVDYITNKLFDMIQWTATNEYIELDEEKYEDDEDFDQDEDVFF